MPHLSPDFVRRVRLPAYLIVAFLSLGALAEMLVAGWPPHIHDLNWRLSLLNSIAGTTGTEFLALLILIVVAQVSASAVGLWTSFSLSVLIALGYLGSALTFALDSLQLRGRIPIDQHNRFDVTVGWALARFGVAELVCLSLAACALAAARSQRRETARDTANRLVVGTSASPPAARVGA